MQYRHIFHYVNYFQWLLIELLSHSSTLYDSQMIFRVTSFCHNYCYLSHNIVQSLENILKLINVKTIITASSAVSPSPTSILHSCSWYSLLFFFHLQHNVSINDKMSNSNKSSHDLMLYFSGTWHILNIFMFCCLVGFSSVVK